MKLEIKLMFGLYFKKRRDLKMECNLKKNDIINLTIEDVNINGEGIGKYNGIAIFVPQTAIGDKLEVKIIKETKKYFVGKIEKILIPSVDRIVPDCDVYKRCGGCAFRHISYAAELKIKEKHVYDCLTRIGGFKDINIFKIEGAFKTVGYRNKAQIPVGYDKENNLISGFYTSGSHDIISNSRCLLHPKIFDEIINEIKNWMKKYNVLAYNEKTHRGTVRHIYLRCSKNSAEIMVCIVINKKNFSYEQELLKLLTSKFKNIKSIVINHNIKDTNVVLGEHFKTIYGKDFITDTLCDLKFNISPESFYQVNHDQTERLYFLAKEMAGLKKDKNLIDLYCGIGTIGIAMAEKVKNVLGVEIIDKAVQNAFENATINNIKNIDFVCADSSEIVSKLSDENFENATIIIDPPRKGCSDKVIDDLIKISPEKIVYISCDPATLAKNLKKLCELDKNYKIKSIHPVDLFPRTKHVETVVLMSCKD